MIYMEAENGPTIIILDQGNLAKLREGKPVHTPGDRILIAYSPDLVYTTEQIRKSLEDSGELLDLGGILKRSLQKPVRIISHGELVNLPIKGV